MTSARALAAGVAASLVVGLASAVAPMAGATAAPAGSHGVVAAAAPAPAAARLTTRDKQLAKKKRCTKRQQARTPVRCQRIARAKAKVRAAARPSPRPVTPRPVTPRPVTPSPVTPSPVTPSPVTPSDTAPFTFAVIPDTQQEVFNDDRRMQQRSEWLVAQRQQLNLRFVDHTGDVVNWGWLAPDQLRIASEGMRPLERAGIPYSLSIGNHDTGAVGWNGQGGYGGGAYVYHPECRQRLGAQCRTELLVRRTTEFNSVFTAARYGAVRGAFEPGKVDNTYSTFSGGGRSWLLLNLELWPRAGAVEWAKRVVEAHPRHNVIVSTHSYLDGDGAGIYGGSDYGSTSPRYLWDNLVSRYANIRFVLSGHVGTQAVRVDTGRHGNKVVSLLQTFHHNQANPVRLVRVDPASGSLRTWVVSPNGRGGDFGGYTRTLDGLTFVG